MLTSTGIILTCILDGYHLGSKKWIAIIHNLQAGNYN